MNDRRIMINEKRLNNILKFVKRIDKDFINFDKILDEVQKLNDYYGSSEWFDDIKYYDEHPNLNIKAGVLSEDMIWNLLENLKELGHELTKKGNRLKRINRK